MQLSQEDHDAIISALESRSRQRLIYALSSGKSLPSVATDANNYEDQDARIRTWVYEHRNSDRAKKG